MLTMIFLFIIFILLLAIVFGSPHQSSKRKHVGWKFVIAVSIIIIAIDAIVDPDLTPEQVRETERLASEKAHAETLADKKAYAEALAESEKPLSDELTPEAKALLESFR
jgi:hypothetical protein